MAGFQTFDFGRAVNAGTQNAIATLRAQALGQELGDRRVMRRTAQEASAPVGHPGIDQVAGQYDPQQHAELLYGEGRPMLANSISQMAQQQQAGDLGLDLKRLEFATKTIPMVRDEKSYDLWKGKAEQFGIIEPGQLPDQYDDNAKAALRDLAGKTAGALKMLTANLPGGKQQQYLVQDGTMTPMGPPVDRWKPDEGDGGRGGLKATDERAIYAQAASLFGGTWDPVNGRVLGLNREQSSQVQAIAERAVGLVQEGQAGSLTESVAMAARELGADIPNLADRTAGRAALEGEVERRFGGGPPAGRPGPFKANAPEPQPRVIRYDAQGNRITE